MFLYEVKEILRKFLLLRPCSLQNSKKVFLHCNCSDKLLSDGQLNAFQPAVIVTTTVLCRGRRRSHCLRSLQ